MTPTPSSPARRVAAVLERAQNTSANSVEEGWCTVFEITTTEPPAKALQVMHMLNAMYEQVSMVEAALGRAGANMARFGAALQRTRSALGYTALGNPWRVVQQLLEKESTVPVLVTAAEFLPADEEAIDPATLVELRASLDQLLESLNNSDLPASVKTFVAEQVAIVRRAIREYPVRGAAAFRAASLTAAIHWAEHEETVRPFEDAPEVKAARQLWPRVLRLSRRVLLVHQLLAAAGDSANLIADTVAGWKGLLGP